jgi:hypothetical protein
MNKTGKDKIPYFKNLFDDFLYKLGVYPKFSLRSIMDLVDQIFMNHVLKN